MLRARREHFNAAIAEHLTRLKRAPHAAGAETSGAQCGTLLDAIGYSALGGKRLRALLLMECCIAAGGLEATAMAPAIAMELVHSFSLVHDDLPAMDDDDIRRGQPTTHKVFGEAEAILAGDWLLAAAFSALSESELPPESRVRLVQVLAGATRRMIEGQGADLAGEQKPPDAVLVEYIHQNKTAALMEAACTMGAICAAAAEREFDACRTFGRHLGLAFQIADDLLDAVGTPAELGKNVRKDAERKKQTYPAVFGVEKARAMAYAQLAQARQALRGFGHGADRLECFIQMVEARVAQRIA